MKTGRERIIELRDEITSQGNKAGLTPIEALAWATRAHFCQEAARLRTEVDKEDETSVAEEMVRAINLLPDYVSALEKIANYITTHDSSGNIKQI